jgi:iron complex outermembrane receptor protein
MRKIICSVLLLIIIATTNANDYQDQGSVIKGKVTDTSGSALAGATVTIDKTKFGINTKADGSYIISGLKDGSYTIRFSYVGYETEVREVNLKEAAILNVILTARPYEMEGVLINATRAGAHTPLAYISISKQALKEQNTGQDIPYLLSLTPSLVETSEAGNGIGYTNLRIRGTDANRINVTIDGIPLNDPESQQVFWVDLPDLASSVDNIQVQRGAGTSSNGAGAFGATISIQTVSPETEPFAEISSTLGSYNTIKNMVAAGTGLLGERFSLQMRLSDLKSDGYVERTGSNHRSAFLTGIYKKEKSSLKVNLILGEEHTGIGWWGVPRDSLATNRRYNPSGEYTDESGTIHYYDNESDNYIQNHVQLIYSLKINNTLFLNTALHYTRGKGYYEEYAEDQLLSDYGLSSYLIGDSVISSTDLIRQKWLSNDFYGLVYSLRYQKNRLEAILGGGMNLYLGDHFGRIIWMRDAGNTEKDYQWYFNKARKGEESIFAKINYSLSGKINFFGDLQYRHVIYKMSGIDDDMTDLGQEHRFGFVNPKAGIFYSISPKQDAYLSFSVANREPTREDYKEATGDPEATPRPETLYDTEAGYKLRTGKSSFGINLYGMIYKDQLVPTGELSNVGYSIMTNVDKSYRLGIETSAVISISDHFIWHGNITLSRNKINNFVEYYTNYNTTDWSSQYLSKSLGMVDIAYSPSFIMASDLAINIHRGIDLHLISKYVGKQYFDNTMNPERTIDPYFVNNLRIDLSPRFRNLKGMEIQFLVNNIFNTMYENNAYGGNWYEDGVEKTWSYFFPQAGTNFLCRLDIKF